MKEIGFVIFPEFQVMGFTAITAFTWSVTADMPSLKRWIFAMVLSREPRI